MMQKGLLTADEYEYLIDSHHPMGERRQKLSSIILGLPEDCVDKFLYCLQETGDRGYEPHRKLHDKLYEFIHTTVV